MVRRRKKKKQPLTTTWTALRRGETKHGHVSKQKAAHQLEKKRRKPHFWVSQRGEAMKIARTRYRTTSGFIRLRDLGGGSYTVDDPLYRKKRKK